jgi:RNA polymerase sigma-70 factor (ECF subfamily)
MPTDAPTGSGADPVGPCRETDPLSGEAMAILRRRVVAAVRRNGRPWLAGQAEDIVQTVLTRLVATLKKSEQEKTFSSIYLERAVYGATVDEIRRLRRRREVSVGQADALEQSLDPGAGPDRQTQSREIARGIQECLVRLARPRRLAVTLRLNGWTLQETACRLGWSSKRAANLVYRGMADLRRCLRRKGLTP